MRLVAIGSGLRCWRRVLAGALGVAALGGAPPVSAQQLPAYSARAPEKAGNAGADTHLFRPAVDSKGFFTVNGAEVLSGGDLAFGFTLDYGRNLLRTADASVPKTNVTDATGATVQQPCGVPTCVLATSGSGVNALARDSFQGVIGINYGIAHRFELGATLPIALMSGDAAYDLGKNGQQYNTRQLDEQSLTGIALHGKVRLLRPDEGVGVAVLVQAGTSRGNASQNLGAEPGQWYWPQVIGELWLTPGGKLKLGANLGFRGHTGGNASFQDDLYGKAQLAEGHFEYGNLTTFQGGLALRALDDLDLIAETYGTLLMNDSASGQKLSQEVAGGFKLFIDEKSYLMLGAGSRAFSTGFEAADLRLFGGIIYEPSIGDRDGDGIRDDEDQCPDQPEDKDHFQDEDGCPDPDNDKDGIPDLDDACPDIPEDNDGHQDADGCPERENDDRDDDGIKDSVDKCPDQAEDKDKFEDEDGCPDPDNDKDGIPDVRDQCPNDPEDKDGWEDADGCPEPDNDRDGILDAQDKCPNEPETFNGHQDQDGCPDKGKVVIEGDDIVILDKVQFATGSVKILPASFPIIDAVATTMEHHPEFLVMEVAGHADERSSDEKNLELTQGRAKSVMDALVARGIAQQRLVSQGYGEYCPLDEGHNPAAWEKNRRVEFKVVKTKSGKTTADRGCNRAQAQGVTPPHVD